MEVRPGLLVTPSVRLARPLDRGAMGEVWLADHLTLHTPVAVKLVARDSDAKQVALHRFRREATLAAQVRHPHALEIHDHGFLDDDTPFIVMELIEGPSLRQALSDGPFDSAELVALIRQVSGVLTAAHALGIVHRDIKP
ncbi:MAG: protein kinase, partial [Myxococcales bacterium]|nr:protein kinase [Myxococcales bacterium]